MIKFAASFLTASTFLTAESCHVHLFDLKKFLLAAYSSSQIESFEICLSSIIKMMIADF